MSALPAATQESLGRFAFAWIFFSLILPFSLGAIYCARKEASDAH